MEGGRKARLTYSKIGTQLVFSQSLKKTLSQLCRPFERLGNLCDESYTDVCKKEPLLRPLHCPST